jgi:hypothetical protein
VAVEIQRVCINGLEEVAPVAVHRDGLPVSRKKLSKQQVLALEVLQRLLQIHGELVPVGVGTPVNAKGVSLDDWRREFQKRYQGKDAASKKAFQRAQRELKRRRLIECSEEFVWTVNNGDGGHIPKCPSGGISVGSPLLPGHHRDISPTAGKVARGED